MKMLQFIFCFSSHFQQGVLEFRYQHPSFDNKREAEKEQFLSLTTFLFVFHYKGIVIIFGLRLNTRAWCYIRVL